MQKLRNTEYKSRFRVGERIIFGPDHHLTIKNVWPCEDRASGRCPPVAQPSCTGYRFSDFQNQRWCDIAEDFRREE